MSYITVLCVQGIPIFFDFYAIPIFPFEFERLPVRYNTFSNMSLLSQAILEHPDKSPLVPDVLGNQVYTYPLSQVQHVPGYPGTSRETPLGNQIYTCTMDEAVC